MYLSKVQLKNIRSFEDTTVELEPRAGWHVVLGDNGSGKSTLIRSVALAMIGEPEIHMLGFKQDWKSWIRYSEEEANIEIFLEKSIRKEVSFHRSENPIIKTSNSHSSNNYFSASYGSFRRLTGGSDDYDNVWKNNPKLAAHLSVFGEDVALDQTIEWLQELITAYSDNIEIAEGRIVDVVSFVNSSQLLLTSYTLDIGYNEKNQPSIFFTDDILIDHNENLVLEIDDLSDGYKSVLALVLELIRQLTGFYNKNTDKIFSKENGQLKVTAPGIVLIDEVAAHLHPSWQARIGDWFTEYFPNIQFIVSTHSPIICRSAKNGSIQKIIHKDNKTIIDKIEGQEKDKLVYGNILEAFETNLFGENISRSPESLKKLERLAALEVRKQFGQTMSPEDEVELAELLKIFPPDARDPFV